MTKFWVVFCEMPMRTKHFDTQQKSGPKKRWCFFSNGSSDRSLKSLVAAEWCNWCLGRTAWSAWSAWQPGWSFSLNMRSGVWAQKNPTVKHGGWKTWFYIPNWVETKVNKNSLKLPTDVKENCIHLWQVFLLQKRPWKLYQRRRWRGHGCWWNRGTLKRMVKIMDKPY